MVKINNQKDFFAGVMFSCIGLIFAVGAFKNYPIGTSSDMGPGFFPFLLGMILCLLGVAIAMTGLSRTSSGGERIGAWAWRPLICVILANAAFGVLLGGLPSLGIPSFGLVIAIYALTLIAALGGDEFKLQEVLILATVLAIGCYVVFVWGLRLQLPAWPGFMMA